MSSAQRPHQAFPCPLCGGSMQVIETRLNESGTRRRRHCASDGCAGKMTTQEIVVCSGDARMARGRWVIMPHDLWSRLAALARLVVDGAETIVSGDASRPAGALLSMVSEGAGAATAFPAGPAETAEASTSGPTGRST